jgi:serpin B
MKTIMRQILSVLVSLGVIASSLCACAPQVPAGGVVQADVLQSDKPRETPLSLQDAQVPDLVAGNSAFAFELYGVLFDEQANLFCSPYSISLALAMTYAGAREETAQQMAETLHFTLPQDRLHSAFNALDAALATRGEHLNADQRFRLHIANALWGQEGYAFLAAFLDELAENYGAGLRVLDFVGEPDGSRQTINEWVEQQTEDKIKDLLPPGSISSDTRLVLSNAIYFNAAWLYPFEEEVTRDGTFHLLDGGEVTVAMMAQSERLGYTAGQGYQAVELPYLGGELSMVILLPAQGTFQDWARTLDAGQLAAILDDMERTQVQLTMPRFTFESGFRLRDALVQLGMRDAFGGTADFSGMTGKRDLFISDVYHKAFVAVDEEGTEAAAATAVVMELTAAPAEPIEFKVDRPFVFLIRDIETDAILFLGHVVDPAQ